MTEVVDIELGHLVENPNNPRKTKAVGIDELSKSMTTLGLIEPIIVRALDETNRFMVIAGHRRLAAARKLKWTSIRCLVVDISGNFEALTAIAENSSRENLTPTDLADAVGRLSGLEVSDAEIMASLSIREGDLTKARAVAGATKTVRAKAFKINRLERQLTLDEQAALVEFAEFPDALTRIQATIANRPEYLDHAIADERANLKRSAKIKELGEMLKTTKVKVIGGWDRHEAPPVSTEPLCNLTDATGKPLTMTKHKSCPGHAASLVNAGHYDSAQPAVVFWCLDWNANGHKKSSKPKMTWYRREMKSSTAKPESAKAKEKATAERRAVIANNKAWTPATEVRLAFVNELLTRKALDAHAKLWTLNEIITNQAEIERTALKPTDSLDDAFKVVVGQVIQHREGELSTCRFRPGSFNHDRLSRYFLFLESQGYTLSDVERLVVKVEKGKKS